MNWFGPSSRLEYRRVADTLYVHYTVVPRKIDYVVTGVAVIGALLFAMSGSLTGLLFSAVAAVSWGYWHLLQTNRTLTVTQDRLVGQTEENETVSVFWKDITGLEYRSQPENGPSGLFVRSGVWNAVLLMDRLNPEQTNEIIHAVYTNFPLVKMSDAEDSFGPLFRADIIELNLTKL